MKRKEFINLSFRTAILLFMAAIVALFASKNQIEKAGTCSTNPNCKSCNKLADCSLDEAKIFKKNGRK
ncbi:MAG: hypothetical protein K9H49_04240 [Bacteroidales bacterium]|nr:hypothetical protein [Bacteroidales bacterium]MCF8390037.1 hypothetical protein [Bacteroidales bacterium]